MSKKTEQLVIRLDPEMRSKIDEEAVKDRRSPSALVRNVVADWLAGRQQQQPATAG